MHRCAALMLPHIHRCVHNIEVGQQSVAHTASFIAELPGILREFVDMVYSPSFEGAVALEAKEARDARRGGR